MPTRNSRPARAASRSAARLPIATALLLALGAALTAQHECPVGPPGLHAPAAPSVPAAPLRVGPSGGGASLHAPDTGAHAGDRTRWQTWWEYNQDRFLALDPADRALPETGEDAFFLGEGAVLQDGDRSTSERAPRRVREALARQLTVESNPLVRAELLAAIGRAGPGAPGAVEALLIPHLADGNVTVSDAATLALGALGTQAATPPLAHLVADDEQGRALSGSSRVSERQRALAAYALGLAAGRTEVDDLARYAALHLNAGLDRRRSPTRDLEVACALGLGQVGAQRDRTAERLLETFGDRGGDPVLRTHMPRALAPLVRGDGDPLKEQVAEELVRALSPRGGERRQEVRRGVVLALGRIGDADDDPLDRSIRAALERSARDGERQERRFALIALGETAGRPGVGPAPFAGSADARAPIFERLGRGPATERLWAALALGLAGRGLRAEGRTLTRPEADLLLESLEESASAENVGAFALAVGLHGDRRATSLLADRLATFGDSDVRGHLALAAGLLGDDALAPALRSLLEASTHRPPVIRDATIALALLGEPHLAERLLALLDGCGGQACRGAVAGALGFSADPGAAPALAALMTEPGRPAPERASAVRALGRLAWPEPLPWRAVYAADVNFLAGPATLASALVDGVADRR
jgi:HEAT repeat protein